MSGIMPVYDELLSEKYASAEETGSRTSDAAEVACALSLAEGFAGLHHAPAWRADSQNVSCAESR